jgi:hypothetical protein
MLAKTIVHNHFNYFIKKLFIVKVFIQWFYYLRIRSGYTASNLLPCFHVSLEIENAICKQPYMTIPSRSISQYQNPKATGVPFNPQHVISTTRFFRQFACCSIHVRLNSYKTNQHHRPSQSTFQHHRNLHAQIIYTRLHA